MNLFITLQMAIILSSGITSQSKRGTCTGNVQLPSVICKYYDRVNFWEYFLYYNYCGLNQISTNTSLTFIGFLFCGRQDALTHYAYAHTHVFLRIMIIPLTRSPIWMWEKWLTSSSLCANSHSRHKTHSHICLSRNLLHHRGTSYYLCTRICIIVACSW